MPCQVASAPRRAVRRAVSAAEIAAYQALSRKYLAPPPAERQPAQAASSRLPATYSERRDDHRAGRP
jgi:hypothetical protein